MESKARERTNTLCINSIHCAQISKDGLQEEEHGHGQGKGMDYMKNNMSTDREKGGEIKGQG
jgi:hypothetical protein